MDLNHRPPVCEPISWDIAKHNKLKYIKEIHLVISFSTFLTLSYFILFYAVPLETR
jgi:hypothetical protein